jgi:four helix bundle protein
MGTLLDRFAQFEATPPADLAGDAMWTQQAYRIAAFLAVICREDATTLEKSPGMARITEQLIASIDDVGTAIAEGYGRLSGRDRARYYEYAFGSAREAREWYRRASFGGQIELAERALLLTRAIKLLTVAARDERGGFSKGDSRRDRATPTKPPQPTALRRDDSARS